MRPFLKIETFKSFRKVDGGLDEEITDTFFVNLMKKWFVPLDSGEASTKILYTSILKTVQEDRVGGKPITFTTETISGVVHLVAYVLDYKVDAQVTASFDLNPDLTNNGDNKLKRLDGGVLIDPDVGKTWTVLNAEVPVTDSTGNPAIVEPPLGGPDIPPSMFLIINRDHIA